MTVPSYRRHVTPSGVEQLADVEFAVDVLGGDPDPLLRLGFDPSVARLDPDVEKRGAMGAYSAEAEYRRMPAIEEIWRRFGLGAKYDEYWPREEDVVRVHPDVVNMLKRSLPGWGAPPTAIDREAQADVWRHEFRHRGTNELRRAEPSRTPIVGRYNIDKEIDKVMGEKAPRDKLSWDYFKWRFKYGDPASIMRENLNRGFDARHGGPAAIAAYEGARSQYPEYFPSDESLTEFMNRIEGRATKILDERSAQRLQSGQ
tara:strand:+ start:77 stop:850 length:774 start_codon:yes stop_codon:yes gene_type:complete